MCTRQFTTCVAFYLFIVVSSKIHADDNVAARLSPKLTEMLRWLPADTETLIVSNRPFELQVPLTAEELAATDSMPSADAMFRSFTTGIATVFLNSRFGKLMQGHSVEFAVEGSRKFRHPDGFGMMPFEGCEIIRFDDKSTAALQQAMQTVLDHAVNSILWERTHIAVFTETVESEFRTYYVVSPRPTIVLCATDRWYLEQLLARMNGEPKQFAFPADLPQWKQVDIEAKVWGMRQYRKLIALGLDPTYHMTDFITIESLGFAIPISRSKGFAFNIDEKRARCRHLIVSKIERMVIEHEWAPIGGFRTDTPPTPKFIEGDIIEVSVPIVSNDDAILAFTLVLMQFLGHGISI